MEHYYYVGPYAEWVVPAGAYDAPPFDSERDGLSRQDIGDDPPRVRRGGAVYEAHVYFPREPEPGSPRPMRAFGGASGVAVGVDLGDADRAAEVAWFRGRYGPALAALAAYYGAAAEVRWGLVGSKF
jgi:hypothetical protein